MRVNLDIICKYNLIMITADSKFSHLINDERKKSVGLGSKLKNIINTRSLLVIQR